MPLPWEVITKLMRFQGIAEELLASARSSRDADLGDALDGQLAILLQETQTVLAFCDESLAAEFARVVVPESADSTPAEVQAAAFVGWLRAGLNVEALENKRETVERQQAAQEPPRRKQTIGFKIRSPLTRDPEG